MFFALFLIVLYFSCAHSVERTQIPRGAAVTLSVHLQSFYYGRYSSDGNIFGDDEVVYTVPTLGLYLSLEREIMGKMFRDTPAIVSLVSKNSSCLPLLWDRNGKASIDEPWTLIRDFVKPVFQFSRYAPLVSYVEFEPPRLNFTLKGYESDSDEYCTYDSSRDDAYAEGAIDDLKLCGLQGFPCSSSFGEQGWIYWGTESEPRSYGTHVVPQWELTGTRVECVVQDGEYWNVDSSIFNSLDLPPTTKEERPYFEVKNLLVHSKGALKFRVRDGALAAGLYARTCKFRENIGDTPQPVFIIDLRGMQPRDRHFLNTSTNMLEFRFNEILRCKSSVALADRNTDAFELELEGLPESVAAFPVTKIQWTFVLGTPSHFSLSFQIEAPLAPTGTNGLTLPTAPPVTETEPQLLCANNCAGRGECVATNQCECIDGWIPDMVEGCKDPNLLVQQQTQVIRVGSLVSESEMTDIPQSSGTPTVADPVMKEPSFLDLYLVPIAAGGAALVVACILCIVLICCVVKKRSTSDKSHASDAAAIEMETANDSDVHTPHYAGVDSGTADIYQGSSSFMGNGAYAAGSQVQGGSSQPTNYLSAAQLTGASNVPSVEYGVLGSATSEVEYSIPASSTTDDIYTVPASNDVYTVPTATNAAEAAGYKDLLTLGEDVIADAATDADETPSKRRRRKKRAAEPSEAPAVPYEAFDPDSERFQKYK